MKLTTDQLDIITEIMFILSPEEMPPAIDALTTEELIALSAESRALIEKLTAITEKVSEKLSDRLGGPS